MYIQTFTKANPLDIQQFKDKKFDDFTQFKRKNYKQKKSPEKQYVEQLVISSKQQIQSSDLIKNKKFAFSFKNSRARQLKIKNKEGAKENIKGKIFQQLRSVIEKNAFKINQSKTAREQSDFRKQVKIKGKTVHQSERIPARRYGASSNKMYSNFESQIDNEKKKQFFKDKNLLTVRKVQSKRETRISWNKEEVQKPQILEDYRRSMSSDIRIRMKRNQRLFNEDLLPTNINIENQIKPWAIKNYQEEDCHFHH